MHCNQQHGSLKEKAKRETAAGKVEGISGLLFLEDQIELKSDWDVGISEGTGMQADQLINKGAIIAAAATLDESHIPSQTPHVPSSG